MGVKQGQERYYPRGTEVVVELDAKGLSRFSLEVLRERARLAITDPVGELDAVAHLDVEQAVYNWIAADVELRTRRPAPTVTDHYLGDLQGALGLPMGVSGGLITCPAHEDRLKSLSWRWASDGFLLLHCFAGCTFDDIRRAVL